MKTATKPGAKRVACVGEDDATYVADLVHGLEQLGMTARHMSVFSLRLAPRAPELTVLLGSAAKDGGAEVVTQLGANRGPFAVVMAPGALAARLEARQRGLHVLPRAERGAELAALVAKLLADIEAGVAPAGVATPTPPPASPDAPDWDDDAPTVHEPLVRLAPPAPKPPPIPRPRPVGERTTLPGAGAASANPPGLTFDEVAAPASAPGHVHAVVARSADERGANEWRAAQGTAHEHGAGERRSMRDAADAHGANERRAAEGVAHEHGAGDARATVGPAGPHGTSETRAAQASAHQHGPSDWRAAEGVAHEHDAGEARATVGAAGQRGASETRAAQASARQHGAGEARAAPGIAPQQDPSEWRAAEGVAHQHGAGEARAMVGAAGQRGASEMRAAESVAVPHGASEMRAADGIAAAPTSHARGPDALLHTGATHHASHQPAASDPHTRTRAADAGSGAVLSPHGTAAQTGTGHEAPPIQSPAVSPWAATVAMPVPPPPSRAAAQAPPPAPERKRARRALPAVLAVAAVLVLLGGAGALATYFVKGADTPAPAATYDAPEPATASASAPPVEAEEPSAVDVRGGGAPGPAETALPSEPAESAEPPRGAATSAEEAGEPAPAVAVPSAPVDARAAERPAPDEAAVAVPATPSDAPTARAAPATTMPDLEALTPEQRRAESDVFIDQARAHEREGRFDEARAAFQRAAEIHDLNPHAYAGLARIALAQGRAREAVGYAERAARLRRRRPEYHVLLGDVRREAGDVEGAREAYRAALALDPTHEEARERLGADAPPPEPASSDAETDAVAP